MAVDKLVDSGKLDACCAAEAAAIIAKGGGTAPLAYDFANNKGFADAIDAIPSGGIPYPDEYVTDGLTAWYDAINNTRSGHDASATTWEDLSGNGYDLKLSLGNAPIVGSNFMYFYGGRLTSDSAPASTDADYPVYAEIVIQTADTGAAQTEYICGLPNSGFGTFTFSDSAQSIKAEKVFSDVRMVSQSSNIKTTYCAGRSILGMLKNADIVPMVTTSGGWSRAVNISVGEYEGGSYVYHGYVLAYRLYHRYLSIDEIRQNFAQDKKRFGIDGGGIGLAELFSALPTLPTGTSKTTIVSSAQKAAAAAEVLAIATNKGWTVA